MDVGPRDISDSLSGQLTCSQIAAIYLFGTVNQLGVV